MVRLKSMPRTNSSRSLPSWALVVLILLTLAVAACSKAIVETADDATITANVKTLLLNDPQIGPTRIDVEAAQGVVTLSGIVTSQAEADRAVQLAKKAAGVKDVRSTLQVNP